MKSLLVLTCLVAVCFAATSPATLDERALEKLIETLRGYGDCSTRGCPNETPVCQANGKCGACSSTSDCPYPNRQTCSGGACVNDKKRALISVINELRSYGDCSTRGCPNETPVCQANGKCGACSSTSDCPYPSRQSCSGGACVNDKKRALISALNELVKKWEKQ